MAAPVWPIEQLLPHAHPMILLDEISDYGDQHLVAHVRIGENSQFFQPRKGVPSWVGIEYMAQAIAAWSGARMLAAGGEVQIGFLLGSRRYLCPHPYFPLGEYLTVRIEQEFESSNMGVFACVIDGSKESNFATASINVFLPANVDEYLRSGTP